MGKNSRRFEGVVISVTFLAITRLLFSVIFQECGLSAVRCPTMRSAGTILMCLRCGGGLRWCARALCDDRDLDTTLAVETRVNHVTARAPCHCSRHLAAAQNE